MYYAYGMRRRAVLLLLLVIFFGASTKLAAAAPPAENPQSGSVGLQGQIPASPPTTGATITVPGNGQNFTNTPVTVAGVCPNDLLVEIYKNDVFSGSVICKNGSFSLQIDLFDGKNDLQARVFDDLNQEGPRSAVVSVNFNTSKSFPGPRITLTSAYAKKGATPGDTLTWPIILSGGSGPYAISADWGDGTPADLISRPVAGEIDLTHVYKSPGFYTVVIKATDANGVTAFLQVVGIGNGPTQQTAANSKGGSNTNVQIKVIWWPLVVCLFLTIIAFWLGRKQQVEQIRTRLRKGQKPF